MANVKVRATIHVEFDTGNKNQARDALDRLQGEVRHSIEFPNGIPTRTTGVVSDSAVVSVAQRTIDGNSG